MNPKIEVVKLNIAKKGQQVGTFSAKVTFEEKYEAIWPGMRIVEGAKGTFVDLPSRQFKEVGFVPFYYLNKALRDLITHEGLEAYRKAVAEKTGEKPASLASVVPTTLASSVVPAVAGPAAVTSAAAPAKTWPKKEWKPTARR